MPEYRDSREHWDDRYRNGFGPSQAARVLVDNLHLLPAAGKALDLACGVGANALLLSSHGLDTWAWDISPVAIEKLRQSARERGLPVTAEARDVLRHPPEPLCYDVIVVAHFLERVLLPHLIAALRPAGLLFYQTFTKARVDDIGPRDSAYRLAENELLMHFSALRIIVYREEGLSGDIRRGWRNEAMLIGQKRAGSKDT